MSVLGGVYDGLRDAPTPKVAIGDQLREGIPPEKLKAPLAAFVSQFLH